ncbi:LPXTG cell wall anchor domain-containing protein [Cryobacterium serini]|uniref:LPXTG cell wall anchor domain-containing protein n=1 Tax=Cryobacterium serini TaxID=1259201 RepID=A0A4R9BK62_9MICO|nr:LPXTG cell wall anchor domain-containing protein [Cryobacterium serini]TFD85988.1 LPXTG cell wall anchor domain-containing protein [Cryobacterium serini]
MSALPISVRLPAIFGAVLLLLGIAGAESAALAAPNDEVSRGVVTDVRVSSDGIHFASKLPAGLFDSLGTLIPNGSMRSTLWIQNPSDVPANVRLSLREPGGGSADLTEYLTLGVQVGTSQIVTTVPLAGGADCAVLAPAQPLAAGATLRVALTIEMMNVTGLTAQNARTDLGILVALRDGETGPFTSSACDDEGVLIPAVAGVAAPLRPAALPRTGVDLPIAALVGGGLMFGIGGLLVTRRRREQ